MNAELIDKLSSRDPKLNMLPAALTPGAPRPLAEKAKARFAAFYSNVAFGWYIACSFADAGVRFPLCKPTGTDRWLFRAYMMRLHSDRWHCPHILDAYIMACVPEARRLKAKVCGMLLSGCGQDPKRHRLAVAEASGIHPLTIEAFDVLFYNILDRQKEAAFVSEHVYPDTRCVEFAEDYVRTADISDLVKRAGYNSRDLSFSTFLAGMGDTNYMAKLSARTDREQELTRHLMGNALLLVHAGALNSRSVGISRSSNLVAAQRQSGSTIEAPPVADAGEFMADALRIALSENDAQRVRIAKEDAGG